MKRIIVLLALTAIVITQVMLGVVQVQTPVIQPTNFNITLPVCSLPSIHVENVALQKYNDETCENIDLIKKVDNEQSEIFITIQSAIIQNFFSDNGINTTLETARLMEGLSSFAEKETTLTTLLDQTFKKMATLFDNLATNKAQQGFWAFCTSVYYYFFPKNTFKENIEQCVTDAQKNNKILRVKIQGMFNIVPIVVQAKSAQELYAAIASWLKNIKSTSILKKIIKADSPITNIFDFDLHIEQINISEGKQLLGDKHQPGVRLTSVHAITYCNKNYDCLKKCCNEKDCPRTHNKAEIVCALGHMLPKINCDGKWNDHIQNVFTKIIENSQKYKDYNEFFHAHEGSVTILFDVMTEFARRMKLVEKNNPSPLFLRLLSKKFDKYGKNVEEFLNKTFYPLYKIEHKFDHHSPIKDLIVSSNIALGGNFYLASVGENTIKFWLSNFSMDTPNTQIHLYDFFNHIHFPTDSINKIIDKIIKIYGKYPELSSDGVLLQIYIPRDKTDKYSYLSFAGGHPFDLFNAKASILLDLDQDTLWQYAKNNFEEFDRIQARILPYPEAAKNFIIYRYYATEKAEQAAAKALQELRQLFDQVLDNNSMSRLFLAEKIRNSKKEFIKKGHEVLNQPDNNPIITLDICDAFIDYSPHYVPSKCSTIIDSLLKENLDNRTISTVLRYYKTIFNKQQKLQILNKNTRQGLDFILLATDDNKPQKIRNFAWNLILKIVPKIDILPKGFLSALTYPFASSDLCLHIDKRIEKFIDQQIENKNGKEFYIDDTLKKLIEINHDNIADFALNFIGRHVNRDLMTKKIRAILLKFLDCNRPMVIDLATMFITQCLNSKDLYIIDNIKDVLLKLLDIKASFDVIDLAIKFINTNLMSNDRFSVADTKDVLLKLLGIETSSEVIDLAIKFINKNFASDDEFIKKDVKDILLQLIKNSQCIKEASEQQRSIINKYRDLLL